MGGFCMEGGEESWWWRHFLPLLYIWIYEIMFSWPAGCLSCMTKISTLDTVIFNQTLWYELCLNLIIVFHGMLSLFQFDLG